MRKCCFSINSSEKTTALIMSISITFFQAVFRFLGTRRPNPMAGLFRGRTGKTPYNKKQKININLPSINFGGGGGGGFGNALGDFANGMLQNQNGGDFLGGLLNGGSGGGCDPGMGIGDIVGDDSGGFLDGLLSMLGIFSDM